MGTMPRKKVLSRKKREKTGAFSKNCRCTQLIRWNFLFNVPCPSSPLSIMSSHSCDAMHATNQFKFIGIKRERVSLKLHSLCSCTIPACHSLLLFSMAKIVLTRDNEKEESTKRLLLYDGRKRTHGSCTLSIMLQSHKKSNPAECFQ